MNIKIIETSNDECNVVNMRNINFSRVFWQSAVPCPSALPLPLPFLATLLLYSSDTILESANWVVCCTISGSADVT